MTNALTIKIAIESAKNLDDLLEALTSYEDETPINDVIDTTRLPIYGPERSLVEGAWSWDNDRAIVGTCNDDFEIVPIDEIDE